MDQRDNRFYRQNEWKPEVGNIEVEIHDQACQCGFCRQCKRELGVDGARHLTIREKIVEALDPFYPNPEAQCPMVVNALVEALTK